MFRNQTILLTSTVHRQQFRNQVKQQKINKETKFQAKISPISNANLSPFQMVLKTFAYNAEEFGLKTTVSYQLDVPLLDFCSFDEVFGHFVCKTKLLEPFHKGIFVYNLNFCGYFVT
jgi:hypothetical protein